MMGLINRLAAWVQGEVPLEEEIERAEALLAMGGVTEPSFVDQYLWWLIVAGGIVLAIAIMLLMIAGRYRREQREAERETAPLFDEVSDPLDDRMPEMAEVVFEDNETLGGTAERDRNFARSFVRGFGNSDPLETDRATEEPLFDEREEEPAQTFRDEAVNVVPLRQSEPVTTTERRDTLGPFEQETQPRYAFATARGGADTMMGGGADDDAPASPDKDRFGFGRSGARSVSQGTDEDRNRPYVAPFIRDDIERAERRQADRIDDVRHEFTRQFDAFKTEQSSRLDLVIAAIDRKLDSLDRRPHGFADTSADMNRGMTSLGGQVERISSAIDGQGQRIRAITQILESKFAEVGRIHDDVIGVHTDVKTVRTDLSRAVDGVDEVRRELDEVKEHVGRLERAILDRAAQDSSTTHRLADVIRGTLPDGSYSFAQMLANGETADCLISFDGLRERIAVDAGFPMEAFHELPSRDAVRRNLPQAKAAEDAFRRAILRAILEAADRCISPADTADSCILFLPSEAAYTILHDRFPDLVRDSQRARVWLCSPSTLMGTLHLLRSLLPAADDLENRTARANAARTRKEDDKRLREEVAALRQRASGLAEELERTRGNLRELITSTEKLGLDSAAGGEMSGSSAHGLSHGLSGLADDRAPLPRYDGTPDWMSPYARDDRDAPPLSAFDKDRRRGD